MMSATSRRELRIGRTYGAQQPCALRWSASLNAGRVVGAKCSSAAGTHPGAPGQKDRGSLPAGSPLESSAQDA